MPCTPDSVVMHSRFRHSTPDSDGTARVFPSESGVHNYVESDYVCRITTQKTSIYEEKKYRPLSSYSGLYSRSLLLHSLPFFADFKSIKQIYQLSLSAPSLGVWDYTDKRRVWDCKEKKSICEEQRPTKDTYIREQKPVYDKYDLYNRPADFLSQRECEKVARHGPTTNEIGPRTT